MSICINFEAITMYACKRILQMCCTKL